MVKLAKNFDSSEFTCRCCGKGEVNPKLVDALQSLRDIVGRPIQITSAYRCEAHNKAVGGEPNSLHCKGLAADIKIAGLTVGQIYHAACGVRAFARGGIGIYPEQGFVHVDVRGKKARWAKQNGKYCNIADTGII